MFQSYKVNVCLQPSVDIEEFVQLKKAIFFIVGLREISRKNPTTALLRLFNQERLRWFVGIFGRVTHCQNQKRQFVPGRKVKGAGSGKEESHDLFIERKRRSIGFYPSLRKRAVSSTERAAQ